MTHSPQLSQCKECKRILRVKDGKLPPHSKDGTTLIRSLLDSGFRNVCRGSNTEVYPTRTSL